LARVARDARELAGVRVAATTALGRAGAQARAVLLELLAPEEGEAAVRGAALYALALTPSLGWEDVQGVAEDGRRARAERVLAVRALAQPGCAGSAALLALTRAREPWLRAQAAGGLALRGDASQAEVLGGLLTDAQPEVRLAALGAIGQLQLTGALIGPVLGRLLDADARVVVEACRCCPDRKTGVKRG
jgi:HEAT repeat protein